MRDGNYQVPQFLESLTNYQRIPENFGFPVNYHSTVLHIYTSSATNTVYFIYVIREPKMLYNDNQILDSTNKIKKRGR